MTTAQLKDRIEQLKARTRKLPVDPSTLSKAQLIQSYWQLKIKSEYWRRTTNGYSRTTNRARTH